MTGPRDERAVLRRGMQWPTCRELDGESRTERPCRRAQSLDPLDAVGAVSATVGALSVEDQVASAGAAKGVRLDESGTAVVVQFHKQMVGGGEANSLQRHSDTPCGDGRWW